MAFYRCRFFAFAFLRWFFVELAPAELSKHPSFLAGTFEPPQSGIEMLSFSYANAWHRCFLRQIGRLTPALNRPIISLRIKAVKNYEERF